MGVDGTSAEAPLRALQASDVGVAVAGLADFAIVFENAKFFKLFTSDGSERETLADRIPGFDALEARAKLEKGRAYVLELEVKVGPRTRHLRLSVSNDPVDASPLIFAECLELSIVG